MGGSGGNFRLTRSEIDDIRDQAQRRLERSRSDAEVNRLLQSRLLEFNDRDVDLIRDRVGEVEDALSDSLADFDRLLFGGSVAKHTYVDGLSDIDCLAVLNESADGSESPAQIRERLAQLIRGSADFSQIESVTTGVMAVTITYVDGLQVQVLPALDRGGEVSAVSSPDGNRWVAIQPKNFAGRLSELNQRQSGAVVPAIKLAKAIIASNIPAADRPSGYHVEALAIAAFDGYEGPRTPSAMVSQFFKVAQDAVRRPIRDTTGQSRHLDAYYGDAGSAERVRLSRHLGRVEATIRVAQNAQAWDKLLDG